VTWGSFNRHALIRLPIQAKTEDGRAVTPPTIEFRLPDGSAHPYLLLTGVAQAMLLGRETDDLDGLLARAEAQPDGSASAEATQVPRGATEIAGELERHHDALEQGDVFPKGMIAEAIRRLRRT
jgi:glutamine synthetase